MIVGTINDANVVRLFGNTRPEANAANDRGRVTDSLPMPPMTIQLRRSPEQEQALTQFIDQLHNPASPNYHHWLTPQQFGAQFGPADSDIQKVTNWLQTHGFTVGTVYPSGMTIAFSGTAGQVRAAFRTEIHHIEARGAPHIANMSDPQIPAALAPAVVGVVGLHDIQPRPRIVRKSQAAAYSPGGGRFLVTPADLATIYNFNPAFNAGLTGQGQTIYLIEDSNLFTNNDWMTFRSVLGLSGYTGGSLTTIHPPPPSGPNNCSDPGLNGDDGEAILDAEWASAAAPNAAIVMATCANLFTAIQNVINAASPPAIISISYGTCEASNTAAGNAAINSIYQQGVAEGISIFVSSGDEGAAGCDVNANQATHGIGVNGLASTPYNVAVGGTDFSDTFSGATGTYWNSSNTATFGSAKSYIPEIPWNDSCASQLIATHFGFATTYGASGFCNNSPGNVSGNNGFLNDTGGSGGPSGCAIGSPSSPGVVSGSCQGYPKPSWQSGVFGIPNDGVRGLPDVSLFAANGVWGHYYVVCYSDTTNGGTPCTGNPVNWSGFGGTSVSSPILAGVQALINQNMGARQGNPNTVLYQLAASQYGASGNASCNSSNGNTIGSTCIFNDVTLGDIDAPCTGTNNCYLPSGTYGVLSTNNNAYAPAYAATSGWDFATGIGTINVANLANGWKALLTTSPALQVSPSSSIATSGNQGGPFSPNSFQYQLSASTGTVGYSITGTPSWLNVSSTSGTVNTAGTTITFTVNSSANSLSSGTHSATITFTDTTNSNVVQTTTAMLTAVAPGVLQVSPPTNVVATGNVGGPFSPSSFSYQLQASAGSVGYSILGVPSWLTASLASGTVTTSPTTVTMTVNSSANGLAVGSYNATITFNDTTNNATVQTITAALSVMSAGSTPGSATVAYVSGNGTDTGLCPITAPCATFVYAISATAADGEIDVLDPGDFGAVTITKSITIRADHVEAGVLVSGTNGIVVQAGATDRVVLEGLDIDGGRTGLHGISIIAGGKIFVHRCTIRDFTQSGINMASSTNGGHLFVSGSYISRNTGGVNVQGTANIGSITNSSIIANSSFAVQANGASNIVGVQNSVLNDHPTAISLLNGGTAISVGPGNLITGAGAFSSTIIYK